MAATNRKKHWENIYETKDLNEVSWYQPTPSTSLELIDNCKILRSAKIIDIGGGDSFLVDQLLDLGYEDITVLDISSAAIERAKQRLGQRADKVTWIVSDVLDFTPDKRYDLWHDRAAFHFLTSKEDIAAYRSKVVSAVKTNGHLIIGTFSEHGPTKCSGITIRQYTPDELISLWQSEFKCLISKSVDHNTPFDTVQNFTFCCFQKNASSA